MSKRLILGFSKAEFIISQRLIGARIGSDGAESKDEAVRSWNPEVHSRCKIGTGGTKKAGSWKLEERRTA